MELHGTAQALFKGRCDENADVRNVIVRQNHISIFITAPFEQRLRRAMELHPGLSAKKAKHLLKKLDRDHQDYYHFFTGRKWGNASNYDLCLNSAAYGIDGSVDFILRMLDREGKTNLPR